MLHSLLSVSVDKAFVNPYPILLSNPQLYNRKMAPAITEFTGYDKLQQMDF